MNSVLSAKILKGLTNSKISSPPIISHISAPISEWSFRFIVLSSAAYPNYIKLEIEQDNNNNNNNDNNNKYLYSAYTFQC